MRSFTPASASSFSRCSTLPVSTQRLPTSSIPGVAAGVLGTTGPALVLHMALHSTHQGMQLSEPAMLVGTGQHRCGTCEVLGMPAQLYICNHDAVRVPRHDPDAVFAADAPQKHHSPGQQPRLFDLQVFHLSVTQEHSLRLRCDTPCSRTLCRCCCCCCPGLSGHCSRPPANSCALAATSRVASRCIKRQVDAAGDSCCSQTALVLQAWLLLLEVPLLKVLLLHKPWCDWGHQTLM